MSANDLENLKARARAGDKEARRILLEPLREAGRKLTRDNAEADKLLSPPPFKQGGGLPVVARGPGYRRCDWRTVSPGMQGQILALRDGDPVEVLLDGADVVLAVVRGKPSEMSPGQWSIWLREGFRGSFSACRMRPPGYDWRRLGGHRLDASSSETDPGTAVPEPAAELSPRAIFDGGARRDAARLLYDPERSATWLYIQRRAGWTSEVTWDTGVMGPAAVSLIEVATAVNLTPEQVALELGEHMRQIEIFADGAPDIAEELRGAVALLGAATKALSDLTAPHQSGAVVLAQAAADVNNAAQIVTLAAATLNGGPHG